MAGTVDMVEGVNRDDEAVAKLVATESDLPRGLPKLPHMLSRNAQIAQVLREARKYRNVPVKECAQRIGTSRRRYVAMEEGKTTIGAVELEELVRFLEVPTHRVWTVVDGTQGIRVQGAGGAGSLDMDTETVGLDGAAGAITVRILPGQTLTLVVGEEGKKAKQVRSASQGKRRVNRMSRDASRRQSAQPEQQPDIE